MLVDTNVWSELMRSEPNPRVREWERRESAHLRLSTIVLGEMLSGAFRLPEGKRRADFLRHYGLLIEEFPNRIVSFDLAAAREYGPVAAFLYSSGRNVGTADAQLAASALALGTPLATRNVKDFEGLGIELVDPWEA
jgi:predicted nucleic acid-binding protein